LPPPARIEAGEAPAGVWPRPSAALAAAGFGPVEYLALRDGETLGDPQPAARRGCWSRHGWTGCG
jgi:hypothetical protein